MSINYIINSEDQKFFSENNYIVLDNFFDKDSLECLYDTINKAPEFWWESSTLSAFPRLLKNIPYLEENLEEIKIRKKFVSECLCTGEFCYRFDRIRMPHHDTCVCNICKFSKTLYSKDLLNFCKNFSNDDSLGEINLEPFFSRYKTKDFLSLHTDAVTNFDSKEKRKLAVVIHLTKDWKPWYGGNLMVLNKESSFIKKALTPKFNSVTLMKVQEEGTPHYVDPLIFGNFDKNRYAISMWY